MTPRTCSTPWRSCCAVVFGPPIRLEISDETSPFLSQLLADQLRVSADESTVCRHRARARPCCSSSASTVRSQSTVRSFRPQSSDRRSRIVPCAIRRHPQARHPAAPPVRFLLDVRAGVLAQAAADPKVLAIKRTLRTVRQQFADHRRADRRRACRQAGAGAGRDQARFDRRQHRVGRKLERAGVLTWCGIVGLKTRKLSLVVRQEADGLRRYCHVGTGNYNRRPHVSTPTWAC